MSPTKSLLLSIDSNAYLASVGTWKQTAAKLESRTATFKGYVDKPGGTYWEGEFAEAAQHNAGEGLKAVGSIRDTVDAAADEVTGTVTYSVLPPLTTAKAIINHAEQQQGVRVNEDLSMTYTPPNGMSDEAVDKSRQAVATMAKELKDNAAKWWAATQTVKQQVETAEKTIAGELNLAAATFNVNNNVVEDAPADQPGIAARLKGLDAPNPDGDPGATKAAAAGADTQANYKEWYPKSTAPAGDKPIDPRQVGGLGAIPGVGDIDKTKPQKLAPTLKPGDVAAFKDITRQKLINERVPADQIEQRVNDAVKAAQAPRFQSDVEQTRTPGAVPLHNSPGDQFNDIVGRANDSAANTVNSQIEQAKILTGQAGPGAPGVAEAWKEYGLAAAKQVHELTTDPLAAPKMGIEQAKDFYNHPGEFIGKNIILGTEALAGGGVGGEAAAGARGLLGDLTGTEGRALNHGIEDAAPGHHPSPGGEHPATGGDHHGGGSGGDHGPTEAGGDHHGGWESSHSDASLSPRHNAAADQFLENARQAEPRITQSLQDIVGNTPGSELTGLEHRLKAEESFKEKLFGSVERYPDMSTAEHLAGMKDSVRYTMQTPEELYVPNTQQAIDNLIADGYEPVKFKNSWDQPGYQGINSFWRDPATGQTFEVQFHTPSSFDAKMETHPLYEQERLPGTTSQRGAELQQQQQQIFGSVPRPSGSPAISLPPNGGHR